jgi:hypothetical protein
VLANWVRLELDISHDQLVPIFERPARPHKNSQSFMMREAEGDLRPAGEIQPLRPAWHDQHSVVLPFANDEVQLAVAVPVCRRNGVAEIGMLISFSSRWIGKVKRGVRTGPKGAPGLPVL